MNASLKLKHTLYNTHTYIHLFTYSVGPLYLWLPTPQVQLTEDSTNLEMKIFYKKIKEKFKK